MKKILLLLLIYHINFSFAQNYFNEDGTLKDESKRKMLLEAFREKQNDEIQFDIDGKYFVTISNRNCGNKNYDKEELQTRALHSSFEQLLMQIRIFKEMGYGTFADNKFEGIIFKTNTLCMYNTRRYHFKFSLAELNNFPEFMDMDELVNYVIYVNESRNIILIKNPKD